MPFEDHQLLRSLVEEPHLTVSPSTEMEVIAVLRRFRRAETAAKALGRVDFLRGEHTSLPRQYINPVDGRAVVHVIWLRFVPSDLIGNRM